MGGVSIVAKLSGGDMRIEIGEEKTRFVRIDGRYLYSPYDPLREIERALGKEKIPERPFFVLFGSAYGYVVDFLLAHGYSFEDIWCEEPVEELKQWLDEKYPMLRRQNLTYWLENALIRGKRPLLFALEGYKRFFSEAYDYFSQWFARVVTQAVENIKVTAFFARNWWVNYVRNMVLHRNRKVYQLIEKRKLPESVVVTASGPSLWASRDELVAWSKKGGKILACLSSYSTLREMGVRPWGVIVSDAGVANVLHGLDIPDEVVVFGSVYANSAFLLSVSAPVVLYDYQKEREDPSFVLSSPSVVIDALELAERLFSGDIFVVGLDLAYTTEGTHPQTNVLQQLRRLATHRLKTVEGQQVEFLVRGDVEKIGEVWTTRAFQLVKREVENRFPHVKIIRPILQWKNESFSCIPLQEKGGGALIFSALLEGGGGLAKAKKLLENKESLVYLRERIMGLPYERAREILLDKYQRIVG